MTHELPPACWDPPELGLSGSRRSLPLGHHPRTGLRWCFQVLPTGDKKIQNITFPKDEGSHCQPSVLPLTALTIIKELPWWCKLAPYTLETHPSLASLWGFVCVKRGLYHCCNMTQNLQLQLKRFKLQPVAAEAIPAPLVHLKHTDTGKICALKPEQHKAQIRASQSRQDGRMLWGCGCRISLQDRPPEISSCG